MRREQFSVGKLTVDSILNQYGSYVYPGPNPSGGMDYYVDNNYGSDGYSGLSWDTPYKTLAKAIAINNVMVALNSRGWATRNRIFYRADTETATLVAFPNKCDVIGCGSYDANTLAGISGNHAPVGAGHQGSRWYNMWFKAVAAATPLVDLTSASAGVQFIGCTFDGVVGTVTHGIRVTTSTFLKVDGCLFKGGFATANIGFATGACVQAEIINNTMFGSAGDGIVMHSGTTVSYGGLVKDNFIQCATICINDASSKFYIIGNRGVSAADDGTAGAGNVVGNVKFSSDNVFSGNDKTFIWPAYTAMS